MPTLEECFNKFKQSFPDKEDVFFFLRIFQDTSGSICVESDELVLFRFVTAQELFDMLSVIHSGYYQYVLDNFHDAFDYKLEYEYYLIVINKITDVTPYKVRYLNHLADMIN